MFDSELTLDTSGARIIPGLLQPWPRSFCRASDGPTLATVDALLVLMVSVSDIWGSSAMAGTPKMQEPDIPNKFQHR